MPLAFSTCWNSARHRDGESIAAEILGLGFRRIEFGHGLTAPQVAGLLAARTKLGFEVSSVHAFCPLPPEVTADNPDCYEFTSHRPDDRRRATRLAMASVDLAEKAGARCVVLHAGRVRTLSATARLRAMARRGLLGTKAYGRAKVEAVRRRERVGGLYVERALEGLAEVADHASAMGIRLGIENREDYEAVPSERELENLLARLDAPNVFYWHDFGHAQIKDHLGLLDHAEWLDRIGARAAGAHVHDVKWPFADHRPPFTGEVAYEKLFPKLPKDAEFVFEMHPQTSAPDILKARDRWLQLFAE